MHSAYAFSLPFLPAFFPAFGRNGVKIINVFNIIVCSSCVKYVALVDLSMFAVGHKKQTLPLLCEHAHG